MKRGCDLTVGQEDMDQPLNFKLCKLTAFNIDDRDRTIEKLKNELRNAQKVSPFITDSD